jgi:hypothetical protein
MFAHWLLETQSSAAYPLAYLYGIDSPTGTGRSGLSMVPYPAGRGGGGFWGRLASRTEGLYDSGS